MSEGLNKRIFEWLAMEGECWHEAYATGGCSKCGLIARPNPDFTSEAGFFLLLAGLKSKWVAVEMTHGIASRPHARIWTMNGDLYPTRINTGASADSLPLALCSATEKLIEQVHSESNG